jgi:uncharacterized protein
VTSDAEGAEAVRLARRAVTEAVAPTTRSTPPAPAGAWLDGRRGTFVTLRRHPTGALRGCIGYPLPSLPLRLAIPRAAVAAATDDPRFPPLRSEELETVTVEVSVLTAPTAVGPDDREAAIVAGRDGVIVETDETSGLLLPQVATEMGWGAAELLGGVCEKAGLRADAWRDPRVRLFRFEAEVFGERSPTGPVERTAPPITSGGARPARRS